MKSKHITAAFAAWIFIVTIITLTSTAANAGGSANLRHLCENGTLDELAAALDAASDDAVASVVFPDGNTPLHIAAEHTSDPRIIELLVKHGAPLSAKGLEGLTPIMLAASYNPVPAVLETLVRLGADAAERDKNGRTILHMSAASNPAVTDAILRISTSHTAARDNEGRTPLWIAAAHSNTESARLIAVAGADVNTSNNAGITPLLAACERQSPAHRPVSQRPAHRPLSQRPDMISLLLNAGADPNVRDPHRMTPLMRALSAGAPPEVLLALLDAGADPFAEDDENRGALFIAASNTDLRRETALALLSSGASTDIDTRDSTLMTPLMTACRANNLMMAELLISFGADVSLFDRNSRTPLLHAAAAGADEALLRLLAENGADVNYMSLYGMTALTSAMDGTVRPRTIGTLISLGADVNKRDLSDIPPVMTLITNWGADDAAALEALGLLINAGADPSAGTWDGMTPLMAAARLHNKPEIFRALFAAGVSPNERSRQGMTPLMIASISSNNAAADAILAAGADVAAHDTEGTTALGYAIQTPDDNSVILLKLVAAGADVNAAMGRGLTPLMDSSLRGHLWAVKALLDAGANVRAGDFVGWTPLHFAARNKTDVSAECVAMLLAAGADRNAADKGGTTPLMVAAACDNAAALKALLDAGADTSLTDRTGRDALGYSELKNSSECIPLLEKAKKN